MRPEGRLKYAEEHKSAINEVRVQRIRRLNPGATDADVYAMWVEDTYKDDLDPEFLKTVQHAIRTRDEPKQGG